MMRKLTLRLRALLATLVFLIAAPAHAAVEITFYSRELGTQFPHAFVVLEGTPDRGGERIDANYGFTATHVTPAVLFGSVRGEVGPVGDGYVRASDPHFSLTLNDEEYDLVMATIARWSALDQPSYNLNRRNCVHFIADVAASLGMTAEVPRNLTRRPRSLIQSLIRANGDWLAQRGARILREPGEERGRRRDAA
ncbi:MAG: hypothetical protein M3N07_06640 [Pseudomonadota bacterium]|nr:hypothetical protein [Pseudomonadota bacterium]